MKKIYPVFLLVDDAEDLEDMDPLEDGDQTASNVATWLSCALDDDGVVGVFAYASVGELLQDAYSGDLEKHGLPSLDPEYKAVKSE